MNIFRTPQGGLLLVPLAANSDSLKASTERKSLYVSEIWIFAFIGFLSSKDQRPKRKKIIFNPKTQGKNITFGNSLAPLNAVCFKTRIK